MERTPAERFFGICKCSTLPSMAWMPSGGPFRAYYVPRFGWHLMTSPFQTPTKIETMVDFTSSLVFEDPLSDNVGNLNRRP